MVIKNGRKLQKSAASGAFNSARNKYIAGLYGRRQPENGINFSGIRPFKNGLCFPAISSVQELRVRLKKMLLKRLKKVWCLFRESWLEFMDVNPFQMGAALAY